MVVALKNLKHIQKVFKMTDTKFWQNSFPKLQKAAHEFLDKHTSESVPDLRTLPEELLLLKSGALGIYYSPFDFNFNASDFSQTRIFLIGITPGAKQGNLAIQNYLKLKKSKTDKLTQLNRKNASFAGTTRSLLVSMLDGLGLPSALGIKSTLEFFDESAHLMSCTSLLRYPVFKGSKDYSGHGPALEKSPVLYEMANALLIPKINELSKNTLIVPLGSAVSGFFKEYIKKSPKLEKQILWNFPHPSGGNRHRAKQYSENKSAMEKKVKSFFK